MKNSKDHSQPYSEETEKIVLGTLMSHRGALDEIKEITTIDSFYDNFHRLIFDAILALDKKGLRYDVPSVMDYLRGKIPANDLWRVVEVGNNECFDIQQHAASLFDWSVRRKFYAVGQYLISQMYTNEDVLDVTEEAVKRLQGCFDNNSAGISSLSDAINEVYDIINKNLSSQGLSGTPVGFKEIDRFGGLHSSDLIVIAADSSNGKTSLALAFSLNAALSGTNMVIYSMEMRKWQIAARMISSKSRVNSRDIMYTALDAEHLQKIDNSVGGLPGDNIFFDDRNTSSIDIIISSIRTMKKRKNISGAVVDYLQILNVNMKGGSKEQFMGDVARRLKNLAVELDIWIIALSQINRGREDKSDPTPTLARIRDSGQINEAADVVMLIYRPEYYGREKKYPYPYSNVSTENTAMIDIAKGRNLGLTKFIVGFDKNTTSFYDLTTVPSINTEPLGEVRQSAF